MISGIQHFSFCRRQWALIHIEEKWNENYLTAEGRVVHERVHNTSLADCRNGVLTCRGMSVKSEKLGITGNCDVVEFSQAKDGIELFGKPGKWKISPIEYKHGSSKANDCDRLQLTAQVLCLEEMFCCEIKEAYLFYNETKRREKVAVTQELRRSVEKTVAEMQELFSRGYTPKVKPNRSCRSCSLSDICLPSLTKTTSVSDYLKIALGGD